MKAEDTPHKYFGAAFLNFDETVSRTMFREQFKAAVQGNRWSDDEGIIALLITLRSVVLDVVK